MKIKLKESFRNPKETTGKDLADTVLGWYDFDTDYIDDGGQRRRALEKNKNTVEWFDEHPIEIKQKAYDIMKSKVHSSDKGKLEREFGKKVNEDVNEGIITIALGVAGGLLLLKLLAKVLKFTIGRVGQHVTLSKDDLLKIKEQVINEAMKTVISNGRGDLSIPIVKLGKYIDDEINSGRITKPIHIVNLFKKLKDGEIKIKESKNLKEAVSADQIRQSMSGFVGPKFAKKASDEDIMKMVALKDKIAKIHNSEILPIQKQIDTLYKQYKIKSARGIEESINEVDYKTAVSQFNAELEKHPSVLKFAKHYGKTPAEIVKALQMRLSTKGDKNKNTKEVSIDFKDTDSGNVVKHSKKFD